MWFDTVDPANLKIKLFLAGSFVTILDNVAAGPPSQSTVDRFIHTQGSPSTTWNITHTLNTENLVISVWDGVNQLIIPDVVQINAPGSVTITFLTAQSGRAILVG